MALSPLTIGISDALGFIGGALIGYWVGQMTGADIHLSGYGTAAMIGILLVGLGGGSGLKVARRWQKTYSAPDKD
jgi:F0F1-type ATP synthase assembly protein I